MRWRLATVDDAPTLARMNDELIVDEGHDNPMTVAELEARMRAWLAADYTAVLFFVDDDALAYVFYRDNEGRGIYLCQFFVTRDHRRRGIGCTAHDLLVREVLASNTCIVVDVLSHNACALSF